MNYIVEPYYFWKGHYKQYFENLFQEQDNTQYIYCDTSNKNFKNSICISAKYIEYEKNFFTFIFSRVSNSFNTIKYLNKSIKNSDKVLFLEFEPISMIYFSLFNRNKNLCIYQTIHSIERIKFKNKIKDSISLIQRKIFNFSIKLLNKKFNTTFIVHYDYHRNQLQKLISQNTNIQVIDYPSPKVKISDSNKMSSKKSILLFGLLREDKQIYEFLLSANKIKDNLTIAGKIQDQRLNKLKSEFNIIDKFLSTEEMNNLFHSHDFIIIPYGKEYTGGAGPLKDALSYGKPVICSNHKLFKGILKTNDIGFVFNTIEELIGTLNSISKLQYQNYSKNCLNYATNNNWDTMKIKYLTLLNEKEKNE